MVIDTHLTRVSIIISILYLIFLFFYYLYKNLISLIWYFIQSLLFALHAVRYWLQSEGPTFSFVYCYLFVHDNFVQFRPFHLADAEFTDEYIKFRPPCAHPKRPSGFASAVKRFVVFSQARKVDEQWKKLFGSILCLHGVVKYNWWDEARYVCPLLCVFQSLPSSSGYDPVRKERVIRGRCAEWAGRRCQEGLIDLMNGAQEE